MLEGLIEMAVQHGPRGCRMVRPALLARYGLDGVLQAEQDAAKRFIALSQPHDDGTGVFEYRLALDVEGKAVLEAALGPLSAPRPVDGERDLRTSDQRRGEALVELVRRAVAGRRSPCRRAPRPRSSSPWTGSPSRSGARRGRRRRGLGHRHPPRARDRAAAGLRRLDHPDRPRRPTARSSTRGRQHRFFTPAQTRRLWLRDGGCTYPAARCLPHWAATRITWSTGRTSARPTWATPPSCASATTPIVHNRRLAGAVATRAALRAGTSRPATRHAGRVGPGPRQLRPAARAAGGPGTSVTPPRTPPAEVGVRGMPPPLR